MARTHLAAAFFGAIALLLSAGAPTPALSKNTASAVTGTTTWVWVHADGRITCDGQTLSLAQLQQRIEQLPRSADIHVKSDPNVPFEAVGRVVYIVARHTGKMGFLLEPREEGSK